MEEYLGTTDAGRILGISPKKIAQAFWDGRLSGELNGIPVCRRVAGRRLISPSYLPTIKEFFKLDKAPLEEPAPEQSPIATPQTGETQMNTTQNSPPTD
jgi:hypothetical protein